MSMTKLASRRFIVVLLSLLMAALALYNGLIASDDFTTIIVWLSGIYIVGKPMGDQLGTLLKGKNNES